MSSLSRELRRLLERTIAGKDGARQIAEAGAEQSLQRLAVDRHEPHGSLTPEERTLRNQLRAHGRQLGDKLDPHRGDQTINHLKQAVAYEHWHRLLFARFLAENDLLMHPKHGVALSLGEVKEDALRLGRDWIDLAAEYAQRMLLREVFRSDDPALRVPLAPEKRRDLEEKLNSLPREVFLASDSLGWVYQFWQDDEKKRVNKSEVDIGADELAAVTQLFTEDYMVLFLLENTVGAWWAAKRQSEGKDASLHGYKWNYLHLNDDGTPSAGTFSGWPRLARDLKILDPCMGSGHFLAAAIPLLAHMRVEEEGLSLEEATKAVLRDNLFGLELDARCSQIAAFNLALTAWQLAGTHFALSGLNLACSGLGINSSEADWTHLAGEDDMARLTMQKLYSIFRHAPVLGSLIDPSFFGDELFSSDFRAVRSLLQSALRFEQENGEKGELAVAADGLLAATGILIDKFTLVATNVPYLGRNRQTQVLAQYCEDYFSDAKADIASCFIERCIRLCASNCTIAIVTKNEPLFASNYRDFRKRLLHTTTWNVVANLGSRAFETISGERVSVALTILDCVPPSSEHHYMAWNAGPQRNPSEKASAIRTEIGLAVSQKSALAHPDFVIATEPLQEGRHLSEYAYTAQGFATSDNPPFVRSFWEFPEVSDGWTFALSAPLVSTPFTGRSDVLLWEDGKGKYYQHACRLKEAGRLGGWKSGAEAWGESGVLVAEVGGLPCTLYTGEMFDHTAHAIIPRNIDDLPAVWAFCRSSDFKESVRRISQKLNVTNETLVKIPFQKDYWQRRFEEDYPDGLPYPSTTDPTQWLFEGHPEGSDHPLQVSVARLVGYNWPRKTGASFIDCPSLAPDGLESYSAKDGIVCLASVAGEENGVSRLRALLQAAFGHDYNFKQLLVGKKSSTLEMWLRDEFFEEHCQIFDLPFVWHIWDGLKDGFHALVNYHRLDRRNLEKLIFSYLGDWLTRQRQDVQNGVEGADTRLAAAEHLQGELKKILEGQRPYDIFVRWKPLDQQPIGWEPDLNDGVRTNIRPWITDARLYRATKPGILRVNPNLKFTKDRGKEPARDPEEFPWFAKSADRIIDHHLLLEEKRRARGLQ
jgi:hypothetical protein